MATRPKGIKKPTSMEDLRALGVKPNEMERIAKAFGIQTPKAEAKTVKADTRGRSRTAAGAKVGPKKERLRAKGEESEYKAPKKATKGTSTKGSKGTSKSKSVGPAPTKRRKYETPKDAGPEEKYHKRIKTTTRTSPGGKAGQKGSRTTITKAKPREAAPLRTGGRRKLTAAGRMAERLRKSKGKSFR